MVVATWLYLHLVRLGREVQDDLLRAPGVDLVPEFPIIQRMGCGYCTWGWVVLVLGGGGGLPTLPSV